MKTPEMIIPIKFRTIKYYYDPDDPTPEDDRELSDRAEDQIFTTALEVLQKEKAFKHACIDLSFPRSDLDPERERSVASALKAHFLRRSEEIRKGTLLTTRVGLYEFRLTIAVCIPAFAGIVIADQFPHQPVAVLTENVLIILSWVVIWQPFQSLVFDRWAKAEKSKLYRDIANMPIRVIGE